MNDTSSRGSWIPVGSPQYDEVAQFLFEEADLLDTMREREWLETMVSPDIDYRLPVRQTVERSRGLGFADDTYHLLENHGSLTSRVRRNETNYAWAEDPPSRLRHFITNIRVREHVDADSVSVASNLLIYRTRQDQTQPQLFSGVRNDVLRREGGRLRLLSRVVLLDVTVIGAHNLSLIF